MTLICFLSSLLLFANAFAGKCSWMTPPGIQEISETTMEETDSLARTFMENITLTGTIDDLARYYGQSRDNVKVVINRKLLSKPKRRVYYSFNAFHKIIPKSWWKRNKNEEDK